jgi:hypothetical protein
MQPGQKQMPGSISLRPEKPAKGMVFFFILQQAKQKHHN